MRIAPLEILPPDSRSGHKCCGSDRLVQSLGVAKHFDPRMRYQLLGVCIKIEDHLLIQFMRFDGGGKVLLEHKVVSSAHKATGVLLG